jgi:hypothetical protein
MKELTVASRTAEWRRLKPLVLDSVSSPITKRVYNMALDEFFALYDAEPRGGFNKATVSAWRVSLEERKLGSSSIIVRMSAIRKLAVEAMDNGLLVPELAAGIQRVKSAKSIGVRMGNWLSQDQLGGLAGVFDLLGGRQSGHAVPEAGAAQHSGHLDAERSSRPRDHRRAAWLWAAPL